MNLAQSSIKLFLANITAAGLQFLGITFFARELGASQMGIFFLFQALLGMASIPADFGLRGAVEKRISEGDSPGVFLSSALILKVIPIFTIVMGIFILRPWINTYIGADLAMWLAFTILLQEAAQLAVFVLKGELRVGETAILNVARQAIWVGGGALLVSYGYGVRALIYSLVAGTGVMLVWGWHKNSVSLENPSFTHARSLFNYGRYNVISSIGGYFYSWMDVAIIGLFLTQTHVGAYEVAWRVTAITILFSKAIASTLFPQVSQWNAKDAKERIESVIHEAMVPSLLFVIPSFFGTLVFSREILSLVFGPEFTIASVVLIILTGEKVLQSIHTILGRALQGIDRPNLAARATIISVCLNFLLNIILINIFGIAGAAVATTLSFAVNTMLHGRYLSIYLSIKFPYVEVGWCILSSLLMAVLLISVPVLTDVETLTHLLSSIIFGAIIYGSLMILYKPIRIRIVNNMKYMVPLE